MIAEKKKTLSFFKDMEGSFSDVIERMAMQNKISAFAYADDLAIVGKGFSKVA